MGKTRLARELADRHSRGAAVVDLVPVSDPAGVETAVAVALSVQEMPGRSVIETLVAEISRRRLLLVLDNCEHLLGACAALVERVLLSGVGCSILATSREPLGVLGERVWPVAPLAVPGHGEGHLPEVVMSSPAVCLFVERAAMIQPGFSLNSYLAPAVAQICRRLDGIPLAIELAAAQVETLTPAEIAARLDVRFELLGGRDSSRGRHDTLAGAIDWSHQLLSPAERALLRRVSVFVGGFELESAEAVCVGDAVERGDVRRTLSALVSKSLVVAGAREARYRLLETIGAYASAKLEQQGEASAFRARHARFYLDLAEELEPELTGPDQTRALERLDRERANLRRALEWSLGHAHGEVALRLAGALVLFWRVRCHFSEGRELLRAALAAGEGEDGLLWAKALWGAGFLGMMAGAARQAAPRLERSLELFREQDDVKGAARALLILANSNQARGEGPTLPLLEQSAALARRVPDRWCLAHALAVAGFDHAYHGEFPRARVVLEESLGVAREAKDDQGLRIALIALGSVALDQGDYGTAQALLEEAFTVAERLEEDYSRAEAQQYLGWLAMDRGEYRRARGLLERALPLVPQIGLRGAETGIPLILARISHAEGDRSRARAQYEEVLDRVGSARPLLALEWMGDLALDEGDVEEGRRLLEPMLAAARGKGLQQFTAEALHRLGRVAGKNGDTRRAAALHNEALELQRRIGAAPAIAGSIEAIALLDPPAGGYEHSARLLGAARALRALGGYARHPWESRWYDSGVTIIRDALGADEFTRALDAGAALSTDVAVDEALKRGRRRGRPRTGWASLTQTEQQVAALAAEGLSNREIAERLFVSLATVKAHLSHIFVKLGVAGRGELAGRLWRDRQREPTVEPIASPSGNGNGRRPKR